VIIVSAYVKNVGGRAALRKLLQVKCILEKPFDLTELLDVVAHELGAGE
jgi:hypothetical protein